MEGFDAGNNATTNIIFFLIEIIYCGPYKMTMDLLQNYIFFVTTDHSYSAIVTYLHKAKLCIIEVSYGHIDRKELSPLYFAPGIGTNTYFTQ